jgi:hypothetical protein
LIDQYNRTARRALLALAAVVLVGCSGDSGPLGGSGSGAPALTPAAMVVDSSRLILQSSADDLADGVYRYAVIGTMPSIDSGAVITGAANGGYLRIVRSVSQGGGQLILQTDPAALSDAVESGELHYAGSTQPSSDMRPVPGTVRWGAITRSALLAGVTIADGRINFNDALLLGSGGSGLSIRDGSLTFTPSTTLDASFSPFVGVTHLEVAVGGSISLNADLVLGVNGALSLLPDSVAIAQTSQPFVGAIGGWPVYGRLVTTVSLLPTLDVAGQASVETTLNASAGVKVGARYDNGAWQSETGPSGSITVQPLVVTIGATVVARLGVKIESQILLYETFGPYLWAEPYLEADAAIDLAHNSWATSCTAAINAGVGVSVKIFGRSLADFNRSDDFLKSNPAGCVRSGALTAQGVMSSVSGDLQTTTAGTRLPAPLMVRVQSASGSPLAGVPVTFSSADGGTFAPATSISDALGMAQTTWLVGPLPGEQKATATAAGFINSPLQFSAVASNTASCPPTPYTLGSAAGGTLTSNDCVYDFGNASNVGVADAFVTMLGAPQTVQLTMTASFPPRIDINIEPSSFYNSGFLATNGAHTVSLKAIVPAGPLYIRPNGGGPGVTGTYSFSVTGNAGDITNCENVVLAANVAAAEQLSSSDCTGPGGHFDRYQIAIPPLWTAVLTMRSAAFDAFLDLNDDLGRLLLSDDDGGGGRDARITYTNSSATEFSGYLVDARSAVGGSTGAYTIQLTLTPPASLVAAPGTRSPTGASLPASSRVGSRP